jgi:RNA polymerase sigma-70 factor, ECF subfamily
MTPEDDGELMLRYSRGDAAAFATLYARHRGPLYRYLLRQSGNPDTASDLFQDVWGRVIASRERYEVRARFRTFLFRIAHNCYVDHYRRRPARADVQAEGQWLDALGTPEGDRPDVRVESAETFARYRSALAALPREQRDVFLLYEESDLSLEDIAAITGVGFETVKSRLRYAVARLRAALLPSRPSAAGCGPRAEQRSGAQSASQPRHASAAVVPATALLQDPGT